MTSVRVKPVVVLVVSDHPAVRESLRHALEAQQSVTVVEAASTLERGLAVTDHGQLDVAVITLPHTSTNTASVERYREFRSQHPRAKILLLVPHLEESVLLFAVLAGASACQLMDPDPRALQEAVVAIGRGDSLLGSILARRILERARRRRDACWAARDCSPQGEALLRMIARGHTNREIAGLLSLSEESVDRSVSAMCARLMATAGRW